MHETGVIHGRFQVLHNDHLKYLAAGKALCRHLVVGITNPDPALTREDGADPHRSSASENPLSYYERYHLIRAVLLEAGVPHQDFSVVPFPVNFPELYRSYVPMDGVFFLTIYDDWGRRKLQQFKEIGLQTKVLWEKRLEDKGLSGTDVRRRMARGEPWAELVPRAAAGLLHAWNVPARLKALYT